jgi:N-acetylglucosaminyldiphosphoundecaprenol N-acetyl-beta-D-mannosaminyltransferase
MQGFAGASLAPGLVAFQDPFALLMSDPIPGAQRLLDIRFDELDTAQAVTLLAGRDPSAPFAYVVTPNVDHVLRLADSRGGELRQIYEGAWLSTCDSRVLRGLARRRGLRLGLAPGSDIVAALFERVIEPATPVTMIGGSEEVAAALRARLGLTRLAHHNPPMGFIHDPAAIRQCEDFVAAHPARFVLLCLGAPQQEMLAARIRASGRASGIGLCVGAAVEFVTGAKTRAPVWMQRMNLEWLHRLLSEPRRLWRRYLVEAPRIFLILWRAPRNERSS